jgi:hypothetical protein
MIYPTNVGGTPGRQQPPAQEILLQADKSAFKAKKSIAAAKKAAAARGASPARGGRATPPPSALTRTALDVDSMDFNKKILHLSWHPYEDTVAIAATNNVLPSICLPGLTSAFPVLCYLSVMSRLGCIAIYVRQNSILAFSTGFGLLLFVHDGNGVMGCRLG